MEASLPNPENAPTAPARPRVLIADADPVAADALGELIAREGHEVTVALSAEEALSALVRAEDDAQGPGLAAVPDQGARPFDVVLCDLSLPRALTGPGAAGGAGLNGGQGGLDLLRTIARRHRGVAFVMVSGYATVESAVESLRLGAVDYLVKPLVEQELKLSLERALRQRALLAENQMLARRLTNRAGLSHILGADDRMRRVFELVEAVAPSRTTVLMTGESGTGKSMIAHAIHHRSPRSGKPFVEISCGSIPETLLESELFGHVKGAFTGAYADKPGRFLAAHGGTIFLDEINSASPAMQLKLLRVLQERRFEPVGSTQTVEVDVRVILASNQPLEGLVAAGSFRQDLYYRINVVKIELPPLRERARDIPLLAGNFLSKFASDLSRQIVGFTPGAMEALARYHYPGNVRELQNIVERATVLTRGQMVTEEDLPPQVLEARPIARADRVEISTAVNEPIVTLERALLSHERGVIVRTLEAMGWNRQKTAEALGINRTTLYKKMRGFGLLEGEGRRAG